VAISAGAIIDAIDLNSIRALDSGSQTVSFTSLNSTTIPVTFTTSFSAAPNVQVNIASQAGPTGLWNCRAVSVTSTGFSIFLFYGANTSTTATWASVPVTWTAMSN
jgi:hypothetical protein